MYSPPQVCSCILIAHLHQVRVPSIATNMQIVVARFFPGGLSKNVSCCRRQLALVLYWGKGSLRYFDARTKRPAIRAELRVDKRQWWGDSIWILMADWVQREWCRCRYVALLVVVVVVVIIVLQSSSLGSRCNAMHVESLKLLRLAALNPSRLSPQPLYSDYAFPFFSLFLCLFYSTLLYANFQSQLVIHFMLYSTILALHARLPVFSEIGFHRVHYYHSYV